MGYIDNAQTQEIIANKKDILWHNNPWVGSPSFPHTKAGRTMHRHGFGKPSTSANADGDHGTVVSARWFRQPHLHPNADDAEIKKRNFLNQTVGMRFFNDEVALMENGWRFLCYASFDIDLVWREKLMWRWCGTDGEWMEIYVLLMA